VIHLGPDVLVTNFYYGIAAQSGGMVYADHTEVQFGGDANYFAYDGGVIYARHAKSVGAADARARAGTSASGSPIFDSWGHGFVAETVPFNSPHKNADYAMAGYTEGARSRIHAEFSQSTHNLIAGYFSNLGGRIHARESRAYGNYSGTSLPNKAVVGVGYWSNSGSILEAQSAQAEGNITGFYARDKSSIDARGAFAWNNNYAGYLAHGGSTINADGSRAFVFHDARQPEADVRQRAGWRRDRSSSISTIGIQSTPDAVTGFCGEVVPVSACEGTCDGGPCGIEPNEVDILVD
jgi:hypothetical protein